MKPKSIIYMRVELPCTGDQLISAIKTWGVDDVMVEIDRDGKGLRIGEELYEAC